MAKLHEIIFKDGRPKIHGFVSRVNYHDNTFRFLTPNEVGMLGQDGTPIPWDECVSVRDDPSQKGVYDGDNRIDAWKEFQLIQVGGRR